MHERKPVTSTFSGSTAKFEIRSKIHARETTVIRERVEFLRDELFIVALT
jgi:hypothetical protein